MIFHSRDTPFHSFVHSFHASSHTKRHVFLKRHLHNSNFPQSEAEKDLGFRPRSQIVVGISTLLIRTVTKMEPKRTEGCSLFSL